MHTIIPMNFFCAIGLYGKAFEILFSPGFRRFLLFPVLLILLLFIGGNFLVGWAVDGLYRLIQGYIASWMEGVSWIFIKILLKILYFYLFLTFGGYILLIVMSPVYSWLSERTENRLTGRKYPFRMGVFLRQVGRGILIVLRNMLWQLFFYILFFLLSFIPVLGLLSPFVLFFISAYFYGFSFMDYAVERRQLNVRQSVRYAYRNKVTVTGIGIVFALALMVPLCSFVACAFVSLLSVIAGTLAVEKTFPSDTLSVRIE
ncbi:EI24 domain-containing protein [Odoribacter lunatus]|uniref:EI24 domain-containing protein n=1 Tax=Odoribacter lunatus TaxID=2941335 RepID=UPI00203B2599|nr:EI24 domain-containing protein [Odoribacter lunatus]